jgi:hypothetical protein
MGKTVSQKFTVKGVAPQFNTACLTVFDGSAHKKRRLGKKEDGGYVTLDLPTVYDLFLGCGVGPDVSFEIDFVTHHPGVPCLLFDGTVDKLPEGQDGYNAIQFIKQNIGPHEVATETNLHSYLKHYSNIFLKMDIEGAELPWLESLSDEQRNKFSQIVMEFHTPFTQRHEDMFNALKRTHFLLHLHGNNYTNNYYRCGASEVLVPEVFECTYVNKSFFSTPPSLNKHALPSQDLDFPNYPARVDMSLNHQPFVHK